MRKKHLLSFSAVAMAGILSISTLGLNNLASLTYAANENAPVKAVTNYNEATVANTISALETADNAIIYGEDATIETDSSKNSKVLSLNGDAFGAGWLKLPDNIYKNVTTGFTLAMDVYVADNAASYTRLFQSSSIAFGTGSGWWDAPDISIDLGDTTNPSGFRHSVYVGKTINTIDDAGKYRSMFNSSINKSSGEWKKLVMVVSSTDYNFYIDGVKASLTGNNTLNTVLNNLFSTTENYLKSYTFNSLGHSVYSGDSDVKAKFDNVAIYSYALSDAQAASLPTDADYLYTFEDSTVTLATPDDVTNGENIYTDGTELTAVSDLTVTSPDGSVTAKVWNDAATGRFFYSSSKDGNCVIEASALGINTTAADLTKGLTYITDSKKAKTIDETYDLISGKSSTASNHCNEITFSLQNADNSIVNVIIRAYDDGIAYIYNVPGITSQTASISGEASEFVLPDSSVTWAYTQVNETYEGTFSKRKMSLLKSSGLDLSTPILASVDTDKYWVLLTEANVFNESKPYCASYFTTATGEKNLKFKFGNGQTTNVSMTYPFNTPWRVAIITDNLNSLVNSNMVKNLNPESKISDTSWIKPGKVAWSWWSSSGDDPIEYGTQKDYIDFAADNGWDYICLDYGWVLWDDYETKVQELCNYAKEKGIGILLWYGVNNTNHTASGAYPKYSLLDEATITREFTKISSWGVKGVKVDYFNSDNQLTMKQMNMVADIAATNKLMVVFHGCTNPNGEERTYPNIMSYEAVYGAEYYKWRTEPSVANCLTYPYTRNILGSMDFTPTAYRVSNISATSGFMLAETVVFESGLQHFAQSIYAYQGYTGLSFLNDVDTAWDTSVLCEGYPGEYTSIARKSGDDWYIGAMTLNARTTDISLDFLDKGNYTAYIYKDNSDGTDLTIETKTVTADDTLNVSLLAEGGFAVKLTKGTMNTSTIYDGYSYYEAENAILTGAAIADVNQYASGLKFVGWLGGNANNTLTFDTVNVDSDGTYELKIYFVTGAKRDLYVCINDSTVIKLSDLLANTNDWVAVKSTSINVSLKAGTNTIKLYNDKAYAPSIDRIAISASTVSGEPTDEYDPSIDETTASDETNDTTTNVPTTGDYNIIFLLIIMLLSSACIVYNFKAKNHSHI